jgi:hypothetical protein
MQPKILQETVFEYTALQLINFPSVERIEQHAFNNSMIHLVYVPNCEFVDETAFDAD